MTLSHIPEHTIHHARAFLIDHPDITYSEYKKVTEKESKHVQYSRTVHPTKFYHPLEYYLLPNWEDFILIRNAFPYPSFPERTSPLDNYEGCKQYSVYFRTPHPEVLYLTADSDQQVLNDPVCKDSMTIEVSINAEYQYRYERLQSHAGEFVKVAPVVMTYLDTNSELNIGQLKKLLMDNKGIIVRFDDGDEYEIINQWDGWMCMYDYAERITLQNIILNGVDHEDPIEIGEVYTDWSTPGGHILDERIEYELSEIDAAISDFYSRIIGKLSTMKMVEAL